MSNKEEKSIPQLINVIFENARRYQCIKEVIGSALGKELIPDNSYTGEYEVLEQIKNIIKEDYNVQLV